MRSRHLAAVVDDVAIGHRGSDGVGVEDVAAPNVDVEALSWPPVGSFMSADNQIQRGAADFDKFPRAGRGLATSDAIGSIGLGAAGGGVTERVFGAVQIAQRFIKRRAAWDRNSELLCLAFYLGDHP